MNRATAAFVILLVGCSRMYGVDRFVRIPAGDTHCISAALESLDASVEPMPEGGVFHEGAFARVWAKRISKEEVKVSSANVYGQPFTELEYGKDEATTQRVAERIVERCGKPGTLMRCERIGSAEPCGERTAPAALGLGAGPR